MRPSLIDHKIIDDKCFWLSSQGQVGTSFRCVPIDLERVVPENIERRLEICLQQLPQDLFIKWHLFSDVCQVEQEGHVRAEAIQEIGQTQLFLIVHFEIKSHALLRNLSSFSKNKTTGELYDFFDIQVQKLLELLPVQEFQELGLNPEPLKFEEISELFPDLGQPISYRPFGIDNGLEYIGILKLHKLTKYEISYLTLAQIKDELPQPFEIVVHQKKYDKELTGNRLRQITHREASPTNATEASKAIESQEAQRKVELQGEVHFGFEMHILLRRFNEKQLKIDLKAALRSLANLGDFLIESIGAEPSYVSTLPGMPFHFAGAFESLTEEHQKMPCFMPIFTRGNAQSQVTHPMAFAFHRLDFTVDFYSIYDQAYKNYCVVAVGDSGSGKSVFLNRIINCANYSQTSRTIIVDVAGSHTRLVSALKGSIHHIDLGKPSGINPFEYLKTDHSEYTISVISSFVSDLMLEENEVRISEEEMFDLNSMLMSYATKRDSNFTLDDFISFLPESFPRKKLLMRFSSKGLHKHLFAPVKDTQSRRPKLLYYNFVNIDVAANRSASRAIMSAIMAEANFSLRAKTEGEEFVFICDETPFFIEACFRSFKYLNKNMRKLKGALFLTVQSSSDLVIEGDTSLISGAGTALLLTYDGSSKEFIDRFKLSEEEWEKLKGLSSVKGEYTQFLLKDKLGSRIGHLILTPREYWQSTTEGSEFAKLRALKEQFPEIHEDTLITILGESKKANRKESKIVQKKEAHI